MILVQNNQFFMVNLITDFEEIIKYIFFSEENRDFNFIDKRKKILIKKQIKEDQINIKGGYFKIIYK